MTGIGGSSPTVSVILPVHNAAGFVRQAVESILRQTYADLELLVVDDGSTDTSVDVVRSIQDPRLRLLRHESNLGLIASLNRGLDEARGRFIARMDADDISMPRRIERQMAYLGGQPSVGICGSWFVTLGAGQGRIVRPLYQPKEVTPYLLFGSPLAHPSVLMRKDILDDHGLRYNDSRRHAEDYDLWVRASRYTQLANVPEVLLAYRQHSGQVSSVHGEAQGRVTEFVRRDALALLHPHAAREEVETHLRVADRRLPDGETGLREARDWLDRLMEINRERQYFQEAGLGHALAFFWYGLCCSPQIGRATALKLYFSRRYGGWSAETVRDGARMALRTVIASRRAA